MVCLFKGREICIWSSVYTTIALIVLILFDEYVESESDQLSAIMPEWIIPLGTSDLDGHSLCGGIQRWRPNGRRLHWLSSPPSSPPISS